MKIEDQSKAAAELDGYELNGLHKRYLTSYDAIIPLIQKQPNPQIVEVSAVMFFKARCVIDLTPAQLLEALLRATGKWKE